MVATEALPQISELTSKLVSQECQKDSSDPFSDLDHANVESVANGLLVDDWD